MLNVVAPNVMENKQTDEEMCDKKVFIHFHEKNILGVRLELQKKLVLIRQKHLIKLEYLNRLSCQMKNLT